MPIKLYNTLTRTRETFEPRDPERVTMYVCGPTVYNLAHIGNARPAVVFDVLARLLRRSHPLTYARNVTDVDDKINAAAKAEGVEIGVLTARYLAAYQQDMTALGVLPPDVEPRVTDHLPQILRMIATLVDAGHAYVAEGHVLFMVGSFAEYGRLSGRDRDELIAGARVEVAPYKRDPGDFVLWKPSGADVVGWDSPWGRGRPGWHIECSAMAETHLGRTIDIHGGGQDLVFPHHENEIAQSTCAHRGQPYSRYWVHNGLIHVDSQKMSKSIGNVLLVRDLLEDAPGEVIRLGLLTAHYRQPLDWTADVLTEARQKLDRMYGALRGAGLEGPATDEEAATMPVSVIEALEDDLNSPRALAELFALARDANRAEDPAVRLARAHELRAGASLLGLLAQDPDAWFTGTASGSLSDPEIDALVAQREALRKQRKFADADQIRDRLAAQGIAIEDGAAGPRWRWER
ncbi:MAG TPA: cysteine--tRNA ligase [Gammaproteobacteria bacterium]|nr:cysteine--tRNA ligase [Gammaproteobacteria bacterium]